MTRVKIPIFEVLVFFKKFITFLQNDPTSFGDKKSNDIL